MAFHPFIHKEKMRIHPMPVSYPFRTPKLSPTHMRKVNVCVCVGVCKCTVLRTIQCKIFTKCIFGSRHIPHSTTITTTTHHHPNPCYTLFQRLHQKIYAAESWFAAQWQGRWDLSPLTLWYDATVHNFKLGRYEKVCSVACYHTQKWISELGKVWMEWMNLLVHYIPQQ